MRSEAIRVVEACSDPGERLNVLREYLQSQILRGLHESGAFTVLSFVGGTALRFVYGVPRFSEDLDFSVEQKKGYNPRHWLAKLNRFLRLSGYDASISWNDRKTVHTGWVRFAALLPDVGLASHRAQKTAIKLEIDTRPPAGARTERIVVQRHVLIALQHHDISSMMAGKIHAMVTRPTTKGRDWYDLMWYLSRTPPTLPNQTLLKNALAQTAPRAAKQPWKTLLLDAVETAGFESARADVAPFLEHPEEADWITREHMRALVERAAARQDLQSS